jgi:hypothetical protein
MSPLGCPDVRELAPELALGIVGGPERAEALDHVSECGACRSLLSELTEAVDALPPLAPEAEPPPGFEKRVLAAIDGRRRRSLRRFAAVAAVAAAAASILSIVGVRLVENTQEHPKSTARAASTVRSTPMVGDTNINVGKLFVSDGRPSSMVLTVDYLPSNGTYTLELRSRSGHAQRLGSVRVDEGRGSWHGVIDVPRTGSVALVDSAGKVACEARLSDVS